jgi:hypothetical protein
VAAKTSRGRRRDYAITRDTLSGARARLGPPARREPARGDSGRDAPLAQSPLQQLTESRVVLHEPIDQIVVLLERHELERGSSIDGHHDRLLMAAMSVLAQVRFSFTQWDHFHDAP